MLKAYITDLYEKFWCKIYEDGKLYMVISGKHEFKNMLDELDRQQICKDNIYYRNSENEEYGRFCL